MGLEEPYIGIISILVFQGLLGRVYETIVILCLLTILVIGLAWVASALFDDDDHSKDTLFGR